MASIKNSPSVDEYILVVSIPLEARILILSNQNIYDAEKSFTFRRESETNLVRREEFDRVRALLKWASCCNARLVEMHYSNGRLRVSLGFITLENMMEFHNSMSVN